MHDTARGGSREHFLQKGKPIAEKLKLRSHHCRSTKAPAVPVGCLAIRQESALPGLTSARSTSTQAVSLASGEPRFKPHGLRKAGESGVPRCKDPRSRPPEGASEALLGPDLPAPRRVAKAIQAFSKDQEAYIASRGDRFEHRLK